MSGNTLDNEAITVALIIGIYLGKFPFGNR